MSASRIDSHKVGYTRTVRENVFFADPNDDNLEHYLPFREMLLARTGVEEFAFSFYSEKYRSLHWHNALSDWIFFGYQAYIRVQGFH